MASRIGDIMTRHVRTCPADARVSEAASVMRDHDIGDVVLMQDGHVSGILTDRDIAVRLVAEGRDPDEVRVDEIASHEMVTVTPDQDVTTAARIMRERGIRRLPVIDGDEPVGMVSLGDLAMERDPESALADISAHRGND